MLKTSVPNGAENTNGNSTALAIPTSSLNNSNSSDPNNLQLLPANAFKEVGPRHILYRKFRDVLDRQRNWMSETAQKAASRPEMHAQLCIKRLKRNGLTRQLYLEHLTWLTCLATNENIREEGFEVDSEEVFPWVYAFQEDYGDQFAPLHFGDLETPMPDMYSEEAIALKIAAGKTLTDSIFSKPYNFFSPHLKLF